MNTEKIMNITYIHAVLGLINAPGRDGTSLLSVYVSDASEKLEMQFFTVGLMVSSRNKSTLCCQHSVLSLCEENVYLVMLRLACYDKSHDEKK